MDFGCPFGAYPDRPHSFQVFAADLNGENRTMVAMVCSQCGEARDVQPELPLPPADTFIAALGRKKRKKARR